MIGQFLTYSIALWEIFPEMVYFPFRKYCQTDNEEIPVPNHLLTTTTLKEERQKWQGSNKG